MTTTWKIQVNDKIITIGELEFKILRWLDGNPAYINQLIETFRERIGVKITEYSGIVRLQNTADYIVKKTIDRLLNKGLVKLINGKLDLTDLGATVMIQILVQLPSSTLQPKWW